MFRNTHSIITLSLVCIILIRFKKLFYGEWFYNYLVLKTQRKAHLQDKDLYAIIRLMHFLPLHFLINMFLVENIFHLLHKQNASVKKCGVKVWAIWSCKLQICAYNKQAYKRMPQLLTTGYILHMCEDVNCCNMYLFCTCNVMYLKNVGMHLFQKGKTDSSKHVWLNELWRLQ